MIETVIIEIVIISTLIVSIFKTSILSLYLSLRIFRLSLSLSSLFACTNERGTDTESLVFSRFSWSCVLKEKESSGKRNEGRNNNTAGHLRSGGDWNTRWGLSSSRTKRGYKARHVVIHAATSARHPIDPFARLNKLLFEGGARVWYYKVYKVVYGRECKPIDTFFPLERGNISRQRNTLEREYFTFEPSELFIVSIISRDRF